VKNPERKCKGVKEVWLDGEKLQSNVIPICPKGSEHTVRIVMG
jgi:cellobiose phosphorylase